MVKFEDTQNFQFLCIEAKILTLRDLLGRLENLNPKNKKRHVFDVGIKHGAEDLQPLSPCVYWNQVRQNFFKSNLKQLGFIGVADRINILIYLCPRPVLPRWQCVVMPLLTERWWWWPISWVKRWNRSRAFWWLLLKRLSLCTYIKYLFMYLSVIKN